jgi:hypothetical protein
MMIDAGFVVAIILVVLFGTAHIRYKLHGGKVKHLYVEEIKCPKCGARPNVPCFFAGGYACNERFVAVEAENDKRRSERDKSSRAGR